MTNFEIEHVPFEQEEVLEADPQMCGAPPPVSDDSWLSVMTAPIGTVYCYIECRWTLVLIYLESM